MDVGGHRFFSKNQQVMDWWADLMPLQGKPAYDDKKLGHEKPLAENGPDPETEDNVMLVRDGIEDLSEAVYIEVLKVGFRLFEHARPQVAKACFAHSV